MNKSILLVMVCVMVFLTGCSETSAPHKTKHFPEVNESNDILTIASFNIENGGQKKFSDPIIMEKIAGLISKYDVIVLQEISNIDEQVDPNCSRNQDAVNSANFGLIKGQLEAYLPARYTVQISPQTKDERYVFIFNHDKMLALSPPIMLPNISQKSELCDLNSDDSAMVRSPAMEGFVAGNWSFSVLTAHTSPSKNIDDLQALQYTYGYVAEFYAWNFGDVILAGDLNADCDYLKQDDEIRFRQDKYAWLIPDYEDTTVGNSDCTYDRFITLRTIANKRFLGYGVEKDITEDVSDHYLVWTRWNMSDMK